MVRAPRRDTPSSSRRKSASSAGAHAEAVEKKWAPVGAVITTANGLRNADDVLCAGERGPTLLDDVHRRERITHFDHERIPELVVHAQRAAANGMFWLTQPIESLSSAVGWHWDRPTVYPGSKV